MQQSPHHQLRRPGTRSPLQLLAISLICAASLQAGEKVGVRPALEFHSIEFTVTDDDGQPVSGATIAPIRLVSKDRLHHQHDISRETIPIRRTERDGKARSRVPTQTADQFPVVAAHWSVSHQHYVTAAVESGPGQRMVTCQLKRGRRIAVSAIDGRTRQRLTSDLFAVLSGRAVAEHWSLMKSGMLVSDGLATSRRMLRIVHLPPEGPARYSTAINLTTYGESPRIILRNVELLPGTRIEGQLDNRVPRPVQKGIISAFVVQGKNEWHDLTTIEPDGRFVLDDLPGGEIVQLTASCDHWVSSDPTPAELEAADMQEKASRLQRSRVYPQVIRLTGDVMHPVIRMEPATNCRFQVIEPGGRPIEGARVRLIPYQGSFDGRSHVFGHGESTRLRLQADTTSLSPQQRVDRGITRNIKGRFTAITGADGTAEISSLPGGPAGSPAMTSFVVAHPDYFAANSGGLGDQGSSRAALYSGRTTDVVVRMKKK